MAFSWREDLLWFFLQVVGRSKSSKSKEGLNQFKAEFQSLWGLVTSCSLLIPVVALWRSQFRTCLSDLSSWVGPVCQRLSLHLQKTMELLLSTSVPAISKYLERKSGAQHQAHNSVSPFSLASWFLKTSLHW